MTLYEIDNRLANLLEMEGEIVDIETGELVTVEDIEALEMARADKIEGWGLWLKNKTAELDAIKAEAKKLSERAAALSGKIEGSKKRYQWYLNGEKVSTPRLSVSYRKTESVDVYFADELPTEFLREKVTYEPDKAAIKAAIKSGCDVAGAKLVSGVSMTIK